MTEVYEGYEIRNDVLDGQELNKSTDLFYGFTEDAVAKMKKEEKELKEVLEAEKENQRKLKIEESMKLVSNMQRLKSDYLNATSYYYDSSKNEILGLDYYGNLSNPSKEVSVHLRSINNMSGGESEEVVDKSNLQNLNSEYDKIYTKSVSGSESCIVL